MANPSAAKKSESRPCPPPSSRMRWTPAALNSAELRRAGSLGSRPNISGFVPSVLSQCRACASSTGFSRSFGIFRLPDLG